MIRPRSLTPMVLALVLTGIAACGDDNGDPTGPDAPVVTISSPPSGTEIPEGASLPLSGSATDPQDGAVPSERLVWTSSIDGTLGTGGSLEVASPSVGLHTITLTARDQAGNEGTASVAVGVLELDFLDGTVDDPQIGIVVNTLENALRLFQLGDPENVRDIPLGASSAVTPVSVAVRGELAAVPLGNAASVALLDLRTRQALGFFLFASGNATGAAWVDDRTVVAANQTTDELGRFTIHQSGDGIAELVPVAPFPNDVIAASESRVLVISSNLGGDFAPIGDGIVTAVDPGTMTVIGTVETGGQNPQFGAIGPDGFLYVPNARDFVAPASLAIIDPGSLTIVDVIPGFPPGSGAVHVDDQGLVYVSAFFSGTVVWDSTSRTFLRGPDDPVCAPLEGGGCRGAFSAATARDGALYQTFFGSPSQDLPPWVFTYAPGTFELIDSIASGLGPVEMEVHVFRGR